MATQLRASKGLAEATKAAVCDADETMPPPPTSSSCYMAKPTSDRSIYVMATATACRTGHVKNAEDAHSYAASTAAVIRVVYKNTAFYSPASFKGSMTSSYAPQPIYPLWPGVGQLQGPTNRQVLLQQCETGLEVQWNELMREGTGDSIFSCQQPYQGSPGTFNAEC